MWAMLMRTVPGLTPDRIDEAFTWEQALMWFETLAELTARRPPETRASGDEVAAMLEI